MTAPEPPAARPPNRWLVGVLVLVLVVSVPVLVLADIPVQLAAAVWLLRLGVVVVAVLLTDGVIRMVRWWRSAPPLVLRVAGVVGYLAGVAWIAAAFLVAHVLPTSVPAMPSLLGALVVDVLAVGAALALSRLQWPR